MARPFRSGAPGARTLGASVLVACGLVACGDDSSPRSDGSGGSTSNASSTSSSSSTGSTSSATTGTSGATTGASGGASACPEPPPSELRSSFDDGGLESWPGTVERPEPTSLEVTSAVTRRGAGAVSLRVRQGQLANGGTRAELAFDAADRAGTRAYYAWSLRLPPDWPDIDRVEDASGRPNWQILGQFHDQPDCELGQTWDDYEGIGASPPVSVQYLWLTLEDPTVREVFETGAASSVVGLDTSVLERPLLGLMVGVPLELRAVTPIDKDRWYDLQLAVRWSQSDDGEVRFRVDDREIVTWRGRNMVNAASHYFKVGLYRNPTIEPDQSLWFDEILMTHDEASMESFAAELATSRMPP